MEVWVGIDLITLGCHTYNLPKPPTTRRRRRQLFPSGVLRRLRNCRPSASATWRPFWDRRSAFFCFGVRGVVVARACAAAASKSSAATPTGSVAQSRPNLEPENARTARQGNSIGSVSRRFVGTRIHFDICMPMVVRGRAVCGLTLHIFSDTTPQRGQRIQSRTPGSKSARRLPSEKRPVAQTARWRSLRTAAASSALQRPKISIYTFPEKGKPTPQNENNFGTTPR